MCRGRVTSPGTSEPVAKIPALSAAIYEVHDVVRGVAPREGEPSNLVLRAELGQHKAQSIHELAYSIRFTGIPELKDVTSGLTREKVFQCLSL
jgi:hypothetical protein